MTSANMSQGDDNLEGVGRVGPCLAALVMPTTDDTCVCGSHIVGLLEPKACCC